MKFAAVVVLAFVLCTFNRYFFFFFSNNMLYPKEDKDNKILLYAVSD